MTVKTLYFATWSIVETHQKHLNNPACAIPICNTMKDGKA